MKNKSSAKYFNDLDHVFGDADFSPPIRKYPKVQIADSRNTTTNTT